MLNPPEAGLFDSKNDLLTYCNSIAREEGYCVNILRSVGQKKIWIQCDKGGSIPDTTIERQRNITSRKTGCPFKLYASLLKDNKWHLSIRNPNHNHPPSPHVSVHPQHRRLTEEQYSEINRLTESGVGPKEIIATLQQADGDAVIIRKDI